MVTLLLCFIAYLLGALPLKEVILPYFPVNKEVNVSIVVSLFKGIISTSVALFFGSWFAASLAAILVVLGSMFPIFPDKGRFYYDFHFVACGAIFILSPLLLVMLLVVFLISFFITRYAYLSTAFTSIATMLLSLIFISQFYVWLAVFVLGFLFIFKNDEKQMDIKVSNVYMSKIVSFFRNIFK